MTMMKKWLKKVIFQTKLWKQKEIVTNVENLSRVDKHLVTTQKMLIKGKNFLATHVTNPSKKV